MANNPDNVLGDLGLSDDEEETAQGVLNKLQTAWINEKFSPELLPYQGDLVDCMLEQVKHMEENVKKVPKSDIRGALHGLELSRIRYIINSYLRTRLDKIELYAYSILEQESKRSQDELHLSEGEFQFAKDYFANMQTAFQTLALRHFPRNMVAFEPNKMTVSPALSSYVFVKALKEVTGLVLLGDDSEGRDEEVDLEAGSQHIIQYRSISQLLKDSAVQLI
jgi:GINS complex subunit 4